MDIKLSLTNEQFRTLLEILYLGDWVMNSVRDERNSQAEEINQYFFEAAHPSGFDDWIHFSAGEKKYFPTKRMEESLGHYIDDFEEAVFWEELVDLLADRDMELALGSAAVRKLDVEEYLEARTPYEEKYWDEFEEHGVDNLYLKDSAIPDRIVF